MPDPSPAYWLFFKFFESFYAPPEINLPPSDYYAAEQIPS
jgi:hypothetical protein